MATELERTLRAAVGKILGKDEPTNVAINEFINALGTELRKATECEVDYVCIDPKDNLMRREFDVTIRLSNLRRGLPKTREIHIDVKVISDPDVKVISDPFDPIAKYVKD